MLNNYIKYLPKILSMYRLLPLLFLLFGSFFAKAQIDLEKSVLITTTHTEDPPTITLHWAQQAGTTGISIHRKTKGATSWGPTYASVVAMDTLFTDDAVEIGRPYEYKITRTGTMTGFGYVFAGIRVDPIERRGKLILIVEESVSDNLADEITRYTDDLMNDGWLVAMEEVAASDTPPDVKALIVNHYEPGIENAVFLLGHVPVPYSGNIAPDGHTPDHMGAWPADVYYADVDGAWTDISINVTGATGTRNDNVPGDGKWDQSIIPSDAELMIGRIDFRNLPAFAENEVELLRSYLDKNSAFRNKTYIPERRGLVENNFASFAEGFGQNGWKNFVPLCGLENVAYRNYEVVLLNESYLWSYGCGPGSYQSAGGIGNTNFFATNSPRSVFTMLFGSYFGDWDSQNNFLRAAVASGTTLTNCWAGRPNWQMHHMAMGETIGYAARLSQNNGSTYIAGFGGRSIHIALMGDPSLRMEMVYAPSDLSITETNDGFDLSWTASMESDPEGYNIYKRTNSSDFFTKVNDQIITGTSYTDLGCFAANEMYEYMVRTVILQENPSGTYYNLSPGVRESITRMNGNNVTADFTTTIMDDEVYIDNTSSNAVESAWTIGDSTFVLDGPFTFVFEMDGTFDIILVAANGSCEDTTVQTVEIVTPVTAIVATTPVTGCVPDTVSFIHASSENVVNYMWLFPGGIPGTSTDENPEVIYENEGSYPVTLIVSNSAYADTVVLGSHIRVGQKPTAQFTCEMVDINEFTFEADEGEGQFFSWDFGDGSTSQNVTQVNHIYAEEGEYTVTLTVINNGCQGINSKDIVVLWPDVEQVLFDQFVERRPNPVTDYLTIKSKDASNVIKGVTIVTDLGKVVGVYDVERGQVKISAKNFTAGQYYIQIVLDNGEIAVGSFTKVMK